MYNKKHNSYWLKWMLFLISVILYCGIVGKQVSAAEAAYEIGTGTISSQYSDLVNKYKSNSADYAQNMLSYQIEALNHNLTVESRAGINSRFEEAVNKCAQLKELKEKYIEYRATVTDEAEIEGIDAQIQSLTEQIDQYNSTISSYQTSLAETSLQAEIESFYVIYQGLLVQEAQDKLLNNFMKKCYGLILLQEQEDYYASCNDYLSVVQKVEEIKFKNGVSTQLSVDLADANLFKNNLALQNNTKSFYLTYTEIKTETGGSDQTRIMLPIAVSKKQYSLENTASQFEYRNVTLAQYKHLERCYQSYLSSNNGTGTLQHQIELKIRDYQLRYNALKNNIRTYVTDAIYTYDNEFQNLALADKEFQIAQKNYNTMDTKKKYKKATELDVAKAKSEMESAEMAYYQCIYNIIIWQNILDNGVYGATP
ncbi:MAG TPA: TolC family protein [Clostridiales bacterium]|nr:TolC family protein [Clostridiales bacterium]